MDEWNRWKDEQMDGENRYGNMESNSNGQTNKLDPWPDGQMARQTYLPY